MERKVRMIINLEEQSPLLYEVGIDRYLQAASATLNGEPLLLNNRLKLRPLGERREEAEGRTMLGHHCVLFIQQLMKVRRPYFTLNLAYDGCYVISML